MEVKFNHVDYIYNAKTSIQKQALKNINIEFKENKINGIIGKSGSGKTTLIELINALLLPTSGNIQIDDFIIEKKRKILNINQLRVNVGLIFQFPEEQFFNNTVKNEIAFGMKYFNYKTEEIDKRCSDALKMIGLDDSYLERDVFSLSSGEMRKVAIASILAFNPKVVILDEPTIGLDNASKENLSILIRRLKNRYKKTVIIISHDVDLLHTICDHLFVLDQGEIVLEGNKYEVFKNVEQIKKYGLKVPKIMEFSSLVLEKKNIKIGYRDDINDLIKDVYRYVK